MDDFNDPYTIKGMKTWLKDEPEMQAWVRDILDNDFVRRIQNKRFDNSTYEGLMEQLNDLAMEKSGRKVIRTMKDKWRQKKHDDDPNNQRLTVTLSPVKIQALDRLVKDRKGTRRSVLESLIGEINELKSELRAENNQKREEKLEDVNYLIERQTKRLKEKWIKSRQRYHDLESKFDAQTKKIKAYEETIQALIYDLAQTTTVLERLDESERMPSPTEKARVPEVQANLKSYYDQMIEKWLKWNKINYSLDNKR